MIQIYFCNFSFIIECINSILDILDEKLFRKNEKNIVQFEPIKGLSDEEASEKSREAFLQSHDSIIVDLFYGQLKSTLICNLCNEVSVTFDPFLMATLPIPSNKWIQKYAYILKYDL